MILQALKEYYDRKAADPDSGIAPFGWEWKEIPFLVVIDSNGKFVNIEDTRYQVEKKKRAKAFIVPKGVKRSSNIMPNTLWDNVEYALGISTTSSGKQERVDEAHQKFVKRLEMFNAIPEIASIIKFLRMGNLRECLSANSLWKDVIESDAYLTFRLVGDEVPVVRNVAFREMYNGQLYNDGCGARVKCLVSGSDDRIALTHSSIKGVLGTNTTGGNIVSFNFDSACSYGRKQGANAPIGERSAFAYTTALNTLLAKDSRQKIKVGDATVVFWASKDSQFEDKFADIFSDPPNDDPDRLTNNVAALLASVKTGAYVESGEQTRFYVLGLAPNSARISVRFWHVGTIMEMSKRFAQWFDDLTIVHGPKDKDHLSMFRLLVSVAPLGKAENVPPNLAGNSMRAILEGLPLPEMLFQAVLRRIKVENGDVNYPRAKIIKACLNRKFTRTKERKITMALDKENTNIGYRLGRLFAVLERIQESANPGLNATIRDKYYASASSTPAAVFGTLMRLKNHHLAKLVNIGQKVNFERTLGEIVDAVPKFPAHLSMDDQGQFAIGYYHQRQNFFTKHDKPEKNDVSDVKSEL